jgi:hypothetical protein
LGWFHARSQRRKVYPITPHKGTGMPKNIEYWLWETVSQFRALEIAQKL